MTIFNKARLPQCTIGGVKVFYKESTITGGRKTITHEYPDTNTRYVEDLGKLERTYNIEAIVNTNVSYSDRDKLLKKLEEGGIISVVHPAFGKKNVVLKNYSLVDNTASLGICNFSLVFEEASLNRMPETIKGNKGFLASLKRLIGDKTVELFESGVSSVKNFKEGFDSFNQTLSNTANEMQRVAQLVQGSADSFSEFTTSINELVDSAGSLVQTPSILAGKIRTSFDNLSVAYERSQDLFQVLTNFFGFDGADRVVVGNSVAQRQIANNQDQLRNIFQVSAMASAYDAAANINYTTLDELSTVISSLENGFFSLPSNIDRELYKALLQMRIEAMNIFNNLSISLPKVTDYTTNKTSLNVLVYSLYGNLDSKTQIRDLNMFKDTTVISGTIKILSNG